MGALKMKSIYSIILMIVFLSSCSSSGGEDGQGGTFPELSYQFSNIGLLKNTSSDTYKFYVKYDRVIITGAAVTISSSNTALLDNSGIVVTSNDTVWTLQFVPKQDQVGVTTISFAVSYNGQGKTYNVTLTVSEVGTYSEYITAGWAAFTAKNYAEAITQFKFAEYVHNDSIEAKSGLGWSRLNNNESDSAYAAFERGEDLLGGLPQVIDRDFRMGMTFAANAAKEFYVSYDYGNDITYYNSIDSLPNFSFSHDATVTEHHVALTMAQSYFAVGSYVWAYRYANALTDKDNFNPDNNTAAGQQELADEIERLRTIL
jgi:hypothetical protein